MSDGVCVSFLKAHDRKVRIRYPAFERCPDASSRFRRERPPRIFYERGIFMKHVVQGVALQHRRHKYD
jgi:hypothetical protein